MARQNCVLVALIVHLIFLINQVMVAGDIGNSFFVDFTSPDSIFNMDEKVLFTVDWSYCIAY
jgi:hypothetical protein